MNFLDRFFAASEERRACVDENHKDCGEFALGQFDAGDKSDFASIAHMEAAVQSTIARAGDFYTPGDGDPNYQMRNGELTFQSSIPDSTVNGRVHVQIVKRSAIHTKAVIIVPHWNAKRSDYLRLAKILSWRGYAVFILNLPHHGKRTTSVPDHVANEFLNANPGAAIASIRQSVLDVRRLAGWLEAEGYAQIDLIGVSLGSCVASLVTAFEPRISRCALLMSAGDFAETVWTGRATSLIRQAFEGHINLQQLQNIWAIISPQHFVDEMVANDTPLLLMTCSRDSVVRIELGRRFGKALADAGANIKTPVLPCGHYTLGSFPFNMVMVLNLLRFLR